MTQAAGLPIELWEQILPLMEEPDDRLLLTSTCRAIAALRDRPELWLELPSLTPGLTPISTRIQLARWIRGTDLGFHQVLCRGIDLKPGWPMWASQRTDVFMISGEPHIVVAREQPPPKQTWVLSIRNLATGHHRERSIDFPVYQLSVLSLSEPAVVASGRSGLEGRMAQVFDAHLHPIGQSFRCPGARHPVWQCPRISTPHVCTRPGTNGHALETVWRLEDNSWIPGEQAGCRRGANYRLSTGPGLTCWGNMAFAHTHTDGSRATGRWILPTSTKPMSRWIGTGVRGG